MRDIYIILRDRFLNDFHYFDAEMDSLNVKDEVSGLDEYELGRLNNLTGQRDYAYRQVKFFEELIEYYK